MIVISLCGNKFYAAYSVIDHHHSYCFWWTRPSMKSTPTTPLSNPLILKKSLLSWVYARFEVPSAVALSICVYSPMNLSITTIFSESSISSLKAVSAGTRYSPCNRCASCTKAAPFSMGKRKITAARQIRSICSKVQGDLQRLNFLAQRFAISRVYSLLPEI